MKWRRESRDTDSTSGVSELSSDDDDDEDLSEIKRFKPDPDEEDGVGVSELAEDEVEEEEDDDDEEDGVLGRLREFSSFSHLFDEQSGVFECEICGEATEATSAAEADRHTTSRHDDLSILQYSQIFHSRGGRLEWYEGSLYKCFLCSDFIDTSNDRLRRHLQSCHNGTTVGEHAALTPDTGDASCFVSSRLRCVLCQKRVAHRRSSLYSHLKSCMSTKTNETTMAGMFKEYYPLLIGSLQASLTIDCVQENSTLPKYSPNRIFIAFINANNCILF